MIRLDVQRAIVERALHQTGGPFVRTGNRFEWRGSARVVSKATHRTYEPEVQITLETQARLADQLATCLCKDTVRIEDLVIAAMVDTRLRGELRITGLPRGEVAHDLSRFLRQMESPAAGSRS